MRRGTIKTLRVLSKRLSARRVAAKRAGRGDAAAKLKRKMSVIHHLMQP
jgi:hypothetical protein